MEEKNAIEELQFIRKVIEETKQNVMHNGKDYIFWGILVIVGMLLQYIFAINKNFFGFAWIWAILIPIGWIYSFINRRSQKIKHPSTYAGKIITSLWVSAGIIMTIIGFVGTASKIITPWAISPIICLIGGCGYFVTGTIVGSKWFKNISYGWWIGGVTMMFVVSNNQFLIMALVMFLFQTIPGIALYKKYRKQTAALS